MTLRQQYQLAADNGLPTPLSSEPTFPEYLNELNFQFWDLVSFKTVYDEYFTLQSALAYKQLFEVEIHPFILRLIFDLDRHYTNEIIKLLQTNNTPQEG